MHVWGHVKMEFSRPLPDMVGLGFQSCPMHKLRSAQFVRPIRPMRDGKVAWLGKLAWPWVHDSSKHVKRKLTPRPSS